MIFPLVLAATAWGAVKLINARRQRVECFWRGDNGKWVLQYYTVETETFELQSVDFSDTLAALYEDVVLEPTILNTDKIPQEN